MTLDRAQATQGRSPRTGVFGSVDAERATALAVAGRTGTLAAALIALSLSLAAGTTAGDARAQSFPNKVVKLIVGHAPGGQSDIIARLIAPPLSDLWGQAVLVENRSGAAGTIAATQVARAPADGYMLFVCSSTNLAIAMVTVRNLAWDPTRDFTMIAQIASIPTVLAVRSEIPATTALELASYARRRPGKLAAGTSGNGSSSAFALEMFKAAAGVDILPVPYSGIAPSVTALLSGQVDVVFADLPLVSQHARSGVLRLVAATGSKRLRAAPELPTLEEQGFDGVSIDSSIGVVAPAGTPPETIAKLRKDLDHVLHLRRVRQQLEDLGFDPLEDTPTQFAAALRRDIERYSVAARRLGFSAAN
jgi:tripartite-type tricarboxylate transporter receptor subunit TctC